MNAMTIYNLIIAKQGSSPNKVTRDIGLALLIITAILMIGMMGGHTNSGEEFVVFAFAMSVIAFIELGSHTFNEYKQERSAYVWLTLPASTTEKWISSFITSFILVPIISLIVMTSATVLANIIVSLFNIGQTMNIFNPFSFEGIQLLKAYWFIHPLFFFAAIYFKKRSVIKAFGTLSLLFISWVIFTALSVNWIFGDLLDNIEGNFSGQLQMNNVISIGGFLEISENGLNFHPNLLFNTVINILFYGYFLFFWSMSFLRFRELEL